MIEPPAACQRVAASYQRNATKWAVQLAYSPNCQVDPAPPVVGLGVPTEATALSQTEQIARWVRVWDRLDEPALQWERRAWSNMGSQLVPARLVATSPSEAARLAGRTRHWTKLQSRIAELRRLLPSTDDLPAALRRHARGLVELAAPDFQRLTNVLTWLADHPTSGLLVRQLPIRGVDTKWIERHRSLVNDLHTAATGRADLGLAKAPVRLRLRLLDPAMAPALPRDVEAPVAQLSALDLRPKRILVLENLQSLLSLPATPGTVALSGGGYGVAALDNIQWLHTTPITYWGDLDTHGFAILNRLRSHLPDACSTLMDLDTFEAHRDLAVPEPSPVEANLPLLTADEHIAYQAIVKAGLRLEQERLPWSTVIQALQLA